MLLIKKGTESAFGAKLDSIADLVFMLAAALKVLPEITLPILIWVWIAFIAVSKTAVIVITGIRQKKFIVAHSIANKTTGFLLFIVPLTIFAVDLNISVCVVCICATVTVMMEIVTRRRDFK